MNTTLFKALRQADVWTGLRPESRHVALTLAIHTGQDLTTTISVPSLERHTGIPAPRIGRAIKQLQHTGLVTRTRTSPDDPLVTTFTVAMPPPLPAARPSSAVGVGAS